MTVSGARRDHFRNLFILLFNISSFPNAGVVSRTTMTDHSFAPPFAMVRQERQTCETFLGTNARENIVGPVGAGAL